jgi:hypothetical protein
VPAFAHPVLARMKGRCGSEKGDASADPSAE